MSHKGITSICKAEETMKINAFEGQYDDTESFTMEFHSEVVDCELGKSITFSKDKFEISIVSRGKHLPINGEMGQALLNKEQALLLYDALGDFLYEDIP